MLNFARMRSEVVVWFLKAAKTVGMKNGERYSFPKTTCLIEMRSIVWVLFLETTKFVRMRSKIIVSFLEMAKDVEMGNENWL